ncbi:BrnT family toxin [Kaistia dalseonensis]|uniref:BrnT family toxin n=1 Tax=Kaistia dalseonensis TaxID=410840 RepID=UPI00352306AA
MRKLWHVGVVRWRSDRNDERRWQRVGPYEGRLFSVVYTEVDNVIRIISARRARPGEERAYRSLFGG